MIEQVEFKEELEKASIVVTDSEAEFNKRITDRMFPNQQNKTSKINL